MKLVPLILSSLLLLGGCASSVPIEIREPVSDSPSVAQAREDPKAYVGKHVRWGGKIVSVENKEQDTWVEVVAKDLGDEGRPAYGDNSFGRFLVRTEGFLDPAIYRADREVTVFGVLENQWTKKIGELDYTYPLVNAERLYLWQDPDRRYVYDRQPYGYYPYYYDPFYYPWDWRHHHRRMWW